jgi:hypothetical protein
MAVLRAKPKVGRERTPADEILQVCLKLSRRFRKALAESPWSPSISHPEVHRMTAQETYRQVADLVQQGAIHQARVLAVTIPVDHLRGLALLLVNFSRKL